MKKIKEKFAFVIFAVFGIGTIILGACIISSNNKFKETAVPAQAKIIYNIF